jgi:predicted ABC-type exoprotein transport system permease subunit
MKIIYDIAAIVLGTFLFFLLFPMIFAIFQLILGVLYVLGQVLILPICFGLIYWAWKKVRKEQKTNN